MPVKITSGDSFVAARLSVENSDLMTNNYARGFAVYKRSNTHVIETGHKPRTSSRNDLGERSCLHRHLEGELIASKYEFKETSRIVSGRKYYDSYLQAKGSTTKALTQGGYYPSEGIVTSLRVQPRYKVPTYPLSWKFAGGSVAMQVTKSGGAITGSLTFVSPLDPNVAPGVGAMRDLPDKLTFSVAGQVPIGQSRYIKLKATYIRQTWDMTKRDWVSHPMDFAISVLGSTSNPCNAVGPTDTGLLLTQTLGLVKAIFMNAEIGTSCWEAQQEALPSLVSGALDAAADLSINTLAYARDVRNLAKDAKSLLGTIRGLKNPKNWANLWLSYRFGLRLFAEDTQQVYKAITRIDTYRGETRRSHRSKTTHRSLSCGEADIRVGLTLFVDAVPMRQRSISHAALALDVAPTLTNLWDLVPYSFVVDWLVPVGEALETIDSMTKLSQFPVRGATVTTRADVDIGPPPDCTGELHMITFKRETISAADLSRRLQPMVTLTSGLGSGVSLKHMFDSMCLAIQRLR